MANEQDFAKELNALITRYLDWVATPRTSLTSWHEKQTQYLAYNLEIYLEAKPRG